MSIGNQNLTTSKRGMCLAIRSSPPILDRLRHHSHGVTIATATDFVKAQVRLLKPITTEAIAT